MRAYVFAIVVSALFLGLGCGGGSSGGGGGGGGGDDPQENRPAVADAGGDQAVNRGSTVTLNGSASSDPDGDAFTYLWAFATRPLGSTATLSDPTAPNPTFTADLSGTYVIRLTVADDLGAGTTDTVTIQAGVPSAAIIANHLSTDLSTVPTAWIEIAKVTLHIAYGHTSHGSQIITGMNGLDAFMGGAGYYLWNDGPASGMLDIDDTFMAGDLGNPDRTTWADRTRTYLDNPANSDVNVVMWSWCGQASTSIANIDIYLNLMEGLIADYPGVKFVFMTGHLDGSGLPGLLHLANEHIRAHCQAYGRVLYDFADIETYDPDGTYFGDKIPTDNCDYAASGSGPRNSNWAIEWQSTHTVGVDWYDCGGAHTQSLNANQKAYAAWWLWARLAGWGG